MKKTKRFGEIKKRMKLLKKISFIFLFLTIATSGTYFSVIFSKNSNFLLRDLKNKYAQVAGSATMNVSLRVVGIPGKPSITAQTGCVLTNPYVKLIWNSTEDTENYDVNRNSLILTTGLTNTTYQDNSVNALTNYTYNVIANGPLGNTPSDDVSVTTLDCPALLPVTSEIQTIDNRMISSFDGTPKTKNKKPRFTGTSNTSNAIINIFVSGETLISANTNANANGYWTWQPTSDLKKGNHKITVTAYDPMDLSRNAIDSLTFQIEEEKKEKKEKTDQSISEENQRPKIVPPEETEKIIPLELLIKVTNEGKKVLQDEMVQTETKLVHHNKNAKDIEILYEIFDKNGSLVVKESEKIMSFDDISIKKDIALPSLIKSGTYKIVARTFHDGFEISSDDYFVVIERPLINLGGGFVYTLTQILEKMSWLIIILFIIFLFFLLLLVIEHNLSKKSLLQITENILSQKGYLGKRKGVSR